MLNAKNFTAETVAQFRIEKFGRVWALIGPDLLSDAPDASVDAVWNRCKSRADAAAHLARLVDLAAEIAENAAAERAQRLEAARAYLAARGARPKQLSLF